MPSSIKLPETDSLQRHVLEIVETFVSELREDKTRHRVKLGDSLERDLGISSLERVELLTRLEQAFDIKLDDASIAKAETARDLSSAITIANPRVAETFPDIKPESTNIVVPTFARTIVDALKWHAERTPDRVHIYLREKDGHETPLTYGNLWQSSMNVANSLAARGLGQQDTIALMLRTEMAFFSSFLGTLLAGCVPVPLYPPFRANRIEEYIQRQLSILGNANVKLMITFSEVEHLAKLLHSQLPALSAIVTTNSLLGEGANLPRLNVEQQKGNKPALIQYTSGSTGNPKGTLLSNTNLMANIRALQQRLKITSDDIGVSWLPLYHDMGLIGTWLGTLYFGTPLALMSPLEFLARPSRWLWTLHAHRATMSAAPNFAYDLCSQRIQDKEIEGLDLSSVRILLNGAEAVQPATLKRFMKRFSSYGLDKSALLPVYGLAECSVGLSAPVPGKNTRIDCINRRIFQKTGDVQRMPKDDPSELCFVSCGQALPEHEIRIVDDTGQQVTTQREGHVQFRGPSATSGYYRNKHATSELIRKDGWLETGDLGYLADDELFITGRHKDLIIKAGRNLQPHEIEDIIGDVIGIRKGCVAAFGVTDPIRGTERFIVAAETKLLSASEHESLRSEIIERVVATLEIPPDLIILTSPGSILKTSSGKIRRTATRDAYLAGKLLKRRSSLTMQWTRLVLRACKSLFRSWGRLTLKLVFTGYVYVLLIITSPLIWIALLLGPNGQWPTKLIGRWTRLILTLAGCRVNMLGLKSVQDLGPAIYVANHASYLDPVLIMAVLPIQLRFAVKGRLASYPFISTAIRKGEHITIEKNDQSQRMQGASAIITPLNQGKSLFVFPEGTFSASSKLLPFRLGAFQASVATGFPIVPVSIQGTREIFPAKTWLVKPHQITVTIGEPIVPQEKTWQEIVRLRNAAQAMIHQTSSKVD